MADKKDKKEKEEEKKDEAAAAAPATEGGEAPAEGAEGGEAAPKSKKKLIIFAAIGLVVVLAGGGAAAYFLGLFGHGAAKEEQEAKPQEIVYYTMPEMIINLSSPGKNVSFLKATIILELPNKLDTVPVEANLPRLMDAFNTYVRELRPSDLAGSAGITRLREELLLRANKALEPTKVNDVLFKEIMVQ